MAATRTGRALAGLPVAVGLLAGCAGGPGAVAGRGGPTTGRAERADLVVAQDGGGNFRTIQEALDALPPDAPGYRVILVRNGEYREKLSITRSRVALVGEDRERTRVVFSELRSKWRETHPDDWGAAVVNVGAGVEDLVLANLTIRNDYGSRFGSSDHQFAVRSGAGTTRISVLHADVIADGGDTISLWNSASGMYYHAGSRFEGHVDFFCPRGWAYATDCDFFSHSTTASIWHDGSADEDQKLVIRSSRFDGTPGFVLGRNTRDGQFYLVDCTFSAAMADRPIYLAREPETFRWGLRAYFSGCRSEGGDLPWLADNLHHARGAPPADQIDARWTFAGRWDPEATLPPVLPFASLPAPRDHARGIPAERVRLRWVGGRNAAAHVVRFGRQAPPPVVARVEGSAYEPGPLAPGTTYVWRVDAVTPAGTIEGAAWSFTTGERATDSDASHTGE
jgi:pectinesterase